MREEILLSQRTCKRKSAQLLLEALSVQCQRYTDIYTKNMQRHVCDFKCSSVSTLQYNMNQTQSINLAPPGLNSENRQVDRIPHLQVYMLLNTIHFVPHINTHSGTLIAMLIVHASNTNHKKKIQITI